MGLLAGFHLFLSVLLAAPSIQNVPALDPGVTVERELSGGETHSYLVVPGAGHLLVLLAQKGVDVEVEVFGPDGRCLAAVDSPNGRAGTEVVLVATEPGVPYRIEVRALLAGSAPGRYEIRAEGVASPPDAEALRSEAARLVREGGPEAKRKALALYSEALSLWRKRSRPAEEAETLVCIANLHAGLEDWRSAIEFHHQALALWTGRGDAGRQTDALIGAGLAHYSLGENAEALAAFQRAADIQQGPGGDRYRASAARNNICLVHHAQGKLRDALSCYQRSLEGFREAGDRGTEAAVLNNIAGAHDLLGEPRRALAVYGEVLALLRSLGQRRREAHTLNNLAVLHGRIGEMEEALLAYDQALATFREVGDRTWEARTLSNLGSTYSLLGEPRRALAYFEQALAVRRELGDRRGEASTLNSSGFVHASLGDMNKAEEHYRRALAIAGEIGDRLEQATSLERLAGKNAASGELDRAAGLLARAVELLREAGDRRALAGALQRMGEVEVRRGKTGEALARFTAALDLRRSIEDPMGQAETLTALARLERGLGRLDKARALLDETLRAVESVRARVSNPDLRASFLGATRQAFEQTVDLLFEMDRREPGKGYAREALVASERARARTLLELLHETRADLRAGADPVLLERERSLQEILNARALRRIELLSRPHPEEERAAAERELREILAELDTLTVEIRRSSPRYAGLTQPPPFRPEDVQRLLGTDTVLLEYALGEERSILWWVSRETIEVFELPARAEIEALARDVWSRLRTLDVPVPGDTREAAGRAALSRMLLAPVAERLGGRRLVIVPDGTLHLVPFAALPDPAAGFADSQPLLLRHEIVVLPSASVLVLERGAGGRPAATRTLAVLADPVFDARDPRAAGEGPAVRRGFDRLPATRNEAERIAALVPAGEVFTALDFRASRETALGGDLGRYRLVHFATHGLINTETPRLSGLVLSLVDEQGRPRDGFLSLADIYGLELAADLVVLSGCETALGREIRGEGLVGLTRGFLYAGAARVVASLWRVQDRTTAELMIRFYRAMLAEGRPPAAALREAQLAIFAERRWRDPYYWSSFILQGDWS